MTKYCLGCATNMAVNGGLLIGQLAIFLSQIAGYSLAVSTTCLGETGQPQLCTDPALPKCCYGKCCRESDFSKFSFSKCSNSASQGGFQTCLDYRMTSCCPYTISSRDMGQSCCKSVTTYRSCQGPSQTEFCTLRNKPKCCYTKCCAYWEYARFSFSKCSGKLGTAPYTTATCYTYPNTQCCTLTHPIYDIGTKRSSVFCCLSRYITAFKTYSSCLLLKTQSGCSERPHGTGRSCPLTATTDYCTDSYKAKCCAFGCCHSATFSTCGLYTTWPTRVCSDYRSPSCCYVESMGNIVDETCCHPQRNGNPNNGDQSSVIGWTVGVSVVVLIFSAIGAAHLIVKKRRALNRRPPTMELVISSTAIQPPPRDYAPPSYETVQEQPPPYDQLIDNDQPPTYNEAVNTGLRLNNDVNEPTAS